MHPIVYFDIETSQLEKGGVADIIQLGAYVNEDINFEAYCLPSRNIGNAAQINGFQMINGNLYQNGEWVETNSIFNGLCRFVKWLEKFGEPVILVAHNCFQFDAKILIQSFHEQEIPYQHVIHGFSDSLSACRHYYNPPCDLDSMMEHFNINEEVKHDAFCDARILRILVLELAQVFKEDVLTFLTNIKWFKSLGEIEKSCVLPAVTLDTKFKQIDVKNVERYKNVKGTKQKCNEEKSVSKTESSKSTKKDSIKNNEYTSKVQTYSKRSSPSLQKYKTILSLVGGVGPFMYFLFSDYSFIMFFVHTLAFFGFIEAWDKVESYKIFNYCCSYLDKIKILLAINGIIVLIHFISYTLYNRIAEIFDYTNVGFVLTFILGAVYATDLIKRMLNFLKNTVM